MIKPLLLIVAFSVLFVACKKNNSFFEVDHFNPKTNFPDSILWLDYEDAIDSGFVIPSIRQTSNGLFNYQFTISNHGEKAQSFFYKIYYQNESYQFPILDDLGINQHEFAHENFYGSWENTAIGFVKTPVIPNDNKEHLITGSFRIVGNPRNEEKYFSSNNLAPIKEAASPEEINNQSNFIDADPNWKKQIIEKAKNNNISYTEQLYADAKYSVELSKPTLPIKKTNDRWKRNPRLGNYSIRLVVTTEDNINSKKIPESVQLINSKKNNQFIHPYYFFNRYQDSIANCKVIHENSFIRVKAKPNLGSGIYVDEEYFNKKNYNVQHLNQLCNDSKELRKKAAFGQYSHALTSTAMVNNLPIIVDIFKENYTIKDDQNNREILNNKRVKKPIYNTKCPCETVQSDPTKKIIRIKNPGNKKNEFKKESVGVISRHGFTYGKYIVKAKLTPLMNKHNVWNGITNAIWLMSQSNKEWNNRRTCEKEGYMPGYHSKKGDKKVPSIAYSEIDFEILKASHRWPETSYKNGIMRPENSKSYENKIMINCTNWDMACFSPPQFGVGVHQLQYLEQPFDLHRWDHWYNAVTSKHPEIEDDLFEKPYYYFEIDWTPTEIIWKIGAEKDQMKVVGYMNNQVTSIPNNQMLMIITQEFHITDWWPEAPFSQDNIPFPKNDYLGYILDFEIE